MPVLDGHLERNPAPTVAEVIKACRDRVEIRRTVNPNGNDTKKVKTSERRFTPLGPSLCATLKNLHRRELRGIQSDWVFPSSTGLLWHERNFERAWYRLRHRAKKAGVRPLPFHCTRHSFITWQLEGGVPTKRVAEWVGASVRVIETHYAHAVPEETRGLVLDRLDRWNQSGTKRSGVTS